MALEANKQFLDDFFKNHKFEDNFEIVVIIDRSGSMGTLQNDVIGGFNTFITEQRKEGGSRVSMVQFDTVYGDPSYWRKPVEDVALLDVKTYIPRGGTALYDAIGKTIAKYKEFQAAGEVKGKVMFVIQTDGEENSSIEITRKSELTKMIDDARETQGWEFVFMGAALEAFEEGSSLGFAAANTAQIAKSAGGVKNSFLFASAGTRAYRGGVALAAEDYDTMKEHLMSGDEKQMEDYYFSAIDTKIKSSYVENLPKDNNNDNKSEDSNS